MLKYKNKNAGFTLVEMLVAVAILVLMITASLTTLSLISQSRAKRIASSIISSFELTRDFAKTHGGDATLYLHKVDNGLEVRRESISVVDEETLLEDKTLRVYYKLSGDDTEYELGEDDADTVTDDTLVMSFRQTSGSIIGPHKVDYIILANNNKTYKLIIKQSTGMIYYDYEIENDHLNAQNNEGKITVKRPTFIYNGVNTEDKIEIPLGEKVNGKYSSVQPELNYDSRYIRIRGDYRAASPGEHSIIFSLKDPYSTCWEGTEDSTDIQLVWVATFN